MLKPDIILMGDYINDYSKENSPNRPAKVVTLVSFVKEEPKNGKEKCFCKVVDESELDFEIKWSNLSLRGYQKFMRVPHDSQVLFHSNELFYVFRIPENGAVILERSKVKFDISPMCSG